MDADLVLEHDALYPRNMKHEVGGGERELSPLAHDPEQADHTFVFIECQSAEDIRPVQP